MKNNKQTAVQSIIEHYEKLSEQGSNQAYVVAKFIKDNFLELEKKQIIDAYWEGSSNWDNDKDAEQYYKDTYETDN